MDVGEAVLQWVFLENFRGWCDVRPLVFTMAIGLWCALRVGIVSRVI